MKVTFQRSSEKFTMNPVRMFLILPLVATALACGCKAHTPQPGTIEEAVAKAKASGQRAAEMRAGVILPRAIFSYSDELERGYALQVRALSRISVPSADRTYIRTWYKFEVLTDLSRHPFRQAAVESTPPDRDIPRKMLPLSRSQILVVRPGGRIISDGISVTYRNAGDFFVPGKEYFVIVEPSGSSHWVFMLPTSDSAYAIGQDGDKLTLMDTQGVTSLHEDIQKHFGDSLHSIEQASNGGPQ